ncbi:hypothetical protein DSO57_1003061 [Entomophthora muscae]|uniref:Uncharacterized protein n=1 Tax=Entomophthora muscae TaxID=34485 RepID=A0ACC2TJD5_9FUNG|nr:hypothetical protein DSO57_1003061 [Entomophthora muscae]
MNIDPSDQPSTTGQQDRVVLAYLSGPIQYSISPCIAQIPVRLSPAHRPVTAAGDIDFSAALKTNKPPYQKS